MSNYTEFYEARQTVLNILKKDLVGPVVPDEVIDELPLSYYAMGKIYPNDLVEEDIEQGENIVDNKADDYDASIDLGGQRKPSSFGITVSPGSADTMLVSVEYATYEPEHRNVKDKETGNVYDETFWSRKKHFKELSWTVSRQQKRLKLDGGAELRITPRPSIGTEGDVVTITFLNTNVASDDFEQLNAQSLFQPSIKVKLQGTNRFTSIERNSGRITDQEVLELDMLYSHVQCYAQGHGCSVLWEVADEAPQEIESTFLPAYNLLQMMPAKADGRRLFNMKHLSEASLEKILYDGRAYIEEYGRWIEELESKAPHLPIHLQGAAQANIAGCRKAQRRILDGLALLESDTIPFRAFQLANKAMYLQRKQSLKTRGVIVSDDEINWYPFQLAFVLHEIKSIAEPESDERQLVDLLWFPTGGGKTEAYLGVAAFAIFLRRLRNPGSQGVSVIMRYTLRLLTVQQFERASVLIMACEMIRGKESIGGEPISIGLWVGGTLVPNKLREADSALKKLRSGEPLSEGLADPVQLKACPWCGAELTAKDYKVSGGRMRIECPNLECDFHNHEGGLPVRLVDEDLYSNLPTYLIATVDKFAQIPMNEESARILGIGCDAMPPSLIIQDELHLISGPLGTIVGLYEAGLIKLCECDGIRPKVIGSTATIRNASSQIKSLYCEGYEQFPPQGLNINDSFFAKLATEDDRPTRLYVGVMGAGVTPTNTLVRINASLLFATRYLEAAGYSEDVVDNYWTLVGYFNTLRELGGASTTIIDSVQRRFAFLANSKFKSDYPGVDGSKLYNYIMELTSRKSNRVVTESIARIERKFNRNSPSDALDFVLATNMISVGVDVGRLGLMVVACQPKTNAEYIQATSRVGRASPGLVIVNYNQMRSRDRSHYEQFLKYHSALYRYVESSSLTPFSDRARDKALHTVYVMLCRYLVEGLASNDNAGMYRDSRNGVQAIKKYLVDYVSKVDPEETESVAEELDMISKEWEDRCTSDLKYKTWDKKKAPSLFKNETSADPFSAMGSMRNVEVKSNVCLWGER